MNDTTPIDVIIVDDSIVVRGIVSRILRSEEDINVVSTAIDGVMALDHVKKFRPTIVLLDIEMPNMNGLEALPKILEASPETKVIMASTLTKANAGVSMKALSLGAADYLQKPSASDRNEMDRFSRDILSKIRALAGRPVMLKEEKARINMAAKPTVTEKKVASVANARTATIPTIRPRALAIASSTGGPQALTTFFTQLGEGLRQVPIFITQHMPAAFTTILADSITTISGRECMEGSSGTAVKPGKIYVAPGDYHMTAEDKASETIVQLDQGPMVNFCRPAADPMVESLINIYGSKLLLVVLTGMGHDGLEGARKLHDIGGIVVAQDEETSVVWGMPRAVTEAGLAHAVLPLNDIAAYVKRAFGEVR